MELVVTQSCPSCGAEIVLGEEARLLRCPYCDVYNYRIEQSAPRYLLPAQLPALCPPEDVVYIPYLRFKGTVFEVRANGVDHRLVDTTRLGIKESALPVSLGLRPQAMRLLPLTASRPGRYVRQAIAGEEAFAQVVAVAELLGGEGEGPLYHRALIGETLSRIYQPCYVHGGKVYDAVVQRPLTEEGSWLARHSDTAVQGDAGWEPRFISAHCPQCSEVLGGESDSLVLHCHQCRTQWQEQGGALRALSWSTVMASSPQAAMLPFWKVSFTTEGTMLTDFGDFLRFTNQPLAPRRQNQHQPLSFIIPAFKLNPKSFLQLASQLTFGQWRLPAATDAFPENAYPVNFPAKEAVQSIKTVLAQSTVAKKMRLPLLAEMRVVGARCSLVYLPFLASGHDVIEEFTGATVLSTALRFGRKL